LQRITYGDREVEVLSTGESHRHELYRVNDFEDDQLDFTGTVTHQLEVRELDVEAADGSMLALQASYRRINQEKVAST
jgi:RNA polymerase II elongation factor ELL